MVVGKSAQYPRKEEHDRTSLADNHSSGAALVPLAFVYISPWPLIVILGKNC
jgi:hypothetical protein